MLRVTTKPSANQRPAEAESSAPAWLEEVRHQVDALRFGQVQIVVHDSRVVQIERIEKIRLELKSPAGH